MIHSRIHTGAGDDLIDPPLDRLPEWATDPATLVWLRPGGGYPR